MKLSVVAFALFLTGAYVISMHPVLAQKPTIDLGVRKSGQSTGLPVPRFVSLKSDEVNVRRGPGWDHGIAWVFRRAGLPVEVIAEFDVWRQVRDSEGASGWVLGTLLSGRRTVLIAPWVDKSQTVNMHGSASQNSTISARLSPGVLGNVNTCDGAWCRVEVGGVSGYIAQDYVWGVYPDEKMN